MTADWVAIHRKHHAKVETEDDPSPTVYGINKFYLRADLYHKEKHNQKLFQIFSNCPNTGLKKIYTEK